MGSLSQRSSTNQELFSTEGMHDRIESVKPSRNKSSSPHHRIINVYAMRLPFVPVESFRSKKHLRSFQCVREVCLRHKEIDFNDFYLVVRRKIRKPIFDVLQSCPTESLLPIKLTCVMFSLSRAHHHNCEECFSHY